MAEQYTHAKLVNLLRQDKIQLWNPPYTTEDQQPSTQAMKELAERYAAVACFPVEEVSEALESIQSQAVKRGEGNKTYRETSVATLELLLPKDCRKEKKNYLTTKLDVPCQHVMDRITEQYGLKHLKLILNGKTLSVDKRLDQQNVKNNSKIMVLKVSEPDMKKEMAEEDEKRTSENTEVLRTQKGFQILSERDGSEDPETTPFLEIADQKGNPLPIPHSEKKALILAMGVHEKGRALMKKKKYQTALLHLLQADRHFSQCGSTLLSTVDNYAVLQLDIVWCYRALEALSYLDDGKQRLQKAEDCFQSCYGAQQQRLLRIQGNSGREDVLFLRLYLLQSLLSYLDGNENQADQKLQQAETLSKRLVTDPDTMLELLTLGFSEREARLGLRACNGNANQAAMHIANRRQEREEMKSREREKRKRRSEGIAFLEEQGYSKRDSARALHQANGDLDKAYEILLDSQTATNLSTNNNTEDPVNQNQVDQLLSMGFRREMVEAALRLMGGDEPGAIQLLLDHGGEIPPELHSPSSPMDLTSRAERPSTSSDSSAGPSSQCDDPMDGELVKEALEDTIHHEEDYLNTTLEEETELLGQIRSYLSRTSS